MPMVRGPRGFLAVMSKLAQEMQRLADQLFKRVPAEPSRQVAKGRKVRAEKAVRQDVRADCVVRDGSCRYAKDEPAHRCQGPSEWAHLGDRKRAHTRGQAPAIRHTTAGSLMLCRWAHNRYDGRQRPALGISARTRRGADGPLRYKEGKA